MSEVKRFCSECGKECTTNDKFCATCGRKLDDDKCVEEQVNTTTKLYDAGQKCQNNKKGGFILLILAILFLGSEFVIRLGIAQGETSLSAIVIGIGFAILGITLINWKIKKYGWLIVGIVFIGALVNSIYSYWEYAHLGNVIICIVSICILIISLFYFLRGNIKK